MINAVTGRGPERAFVKALVDLLQEVIYPDGGDDFVYCPRCGGDDFTKRAEPDDEWGSGAVLFKRCQSCGYEAVTEVH